MQHPSGIPEKIMKVDRGYISSETSLEGI